MAPTKNAKLVQAQLPGSFLKVTKGCRVEKPKASKNKSETPSPGKQQALVQKTLVPGPAPAAGPVLRDGGEEIVGFGTHQAVCKVLVLNQHSSVFFEGSIPEVDKSENAFTETRRQAESFRIIGESIVVRCEDGPPLLYLIKGGMKAGFSPAKQLALETKSLGAIRSLVKGYKPKMPKPDDSRAKADCQVQAKKCQAAGLPYGRYNLIFNYGIGQYHKNPNIHQDSLPRGIGKINSLVDYIQATAWEHEQVAKWISVIDPVKYEELHNCYQALGGQELKHLYQGPDACQSGLVLLVNQSVGPHKDQKDARDNWTTTNTHAAEVGGKYKGGHLVLPDVAIKIDQQPGDLLLTHAAVLTHYVDQIEEGERFCHVRFTKIDILNRPAPTPDLGLTCPIPGCTRRPCRSWAVFTKHLKGPGGKRRATASRATYHFLPTEEVKELVKQKKMEYESRGAQS